MALVVALHILASLFLIVTVLIQPAKGADFSSLAGGATQTFFGARGALTMLVKVTVGLAVVFFATSLTLGLFSAGKTRTVLPADSADEAPLAATAPETPAPLPPAQEPAPAPEAEKPAPSEESK